MDPDSIPFSAENIRTMRADLKNEPDTLAKQKHNIEQQIVNLQDHHCQHASRIVWQGGGSCSDCGKKL